MSVPDREATLARRQAWAALIGLAVFAVLIVVIFLKPGGPGRAEPVRFAVPTTGGLKAGDEVRVAGVQVGEVSEVTAGPDHTSVLTLEVDRSATPVYSDARIEIRPRLVLEGSYYVALSPGTSAAGEPEDEGVLPASQTVVPVGLDELVNVFEQPVRGSLHRWIDEFATGLGPRGDYAGSAGLREATREFARALPPLERAARAGRGLEPGDLGRTLRAGADTFTQLGQRPASLSELVTGFSRVSGALAAEDAALAASFRRLDRTMRVGTPSLRRLEAALPALTTFSRELRPALVAAPEPLRGAGGLLSQIERLSRPGELPELIDRLPALTGALIRFEDEAELLLPQLEPALNCLRTRVVPTLETELADDSNSTGDPAYLDLVHAFTGAIGAAPTFDGNGVSVRTGVTEGENTLDNVIAGGSTLVGGNDALQGVRPTWLGYGVEPAYRPDEWCSAQDLPDLTLRSGGPPAALDPQPLSGDGGGAP